MPREMTAMERVMTTLSHREPDRVPFFLLLTMHGARTLQMSIPAYLSNPMAVVEGQIQMRERYGHDCLYAFTYAALEVEAWGGEVLFHEDGPPNAGRPLLESVADIAKLHPPDVSRSPCLQRMLTVIRELASRAQGTVPVIGAVISPLSLPVMQMGFGPYLELLLERPDDFEKLMHVNEEFCVAWANAQLAAGATVLGYFDPLASPTILPPETYRRQGLPVDARTLKRIQGLTAVHLASGRVEGVLDDLSHLGSVAVGVGFMEDLAEVKALAAGRVALLGHINGLAMRRWTPQDAEAVVHDAILKGGPGGGYILSDAHGEIPWQVPESVLDSIAGAVRRWGSYPLKAA